MAISAEDTMVLCNLRATLVQQQTTLTQQQATLAAGNQPTLDQQIADKTAEVAAYYASQDGTLDDAEWRAHLGELQQQRLTLLDQNRQIIAANEAYAAGAITLNSQIADTIAAVTVTQDAIKAYLEGLSLGAPDPASPSIQQQIDDLSMAVLAAQGVTL